MVQETPKNRSRILLYLTFRNATEAVIIRCGAAGCPRRNQRHRRPLKLPSIRILLESDMTLLRFACALTLLVSTLGAAEELTPYPKPAPAPALQLQDTQGNTHKLSGYRGQVVLLNFWATWCPPCVKEMPSLQRLWQLVHQEDIEVLAVNIGEPTEVVAEFLQQYLLDFPVLLDTEATVADVWKVQGLPTTFIVDPEGQLVYRAMGDREWDDPEILARLRSLKKAGVKTPAQQLTVKPRLERSAGDS